MSMKRNRNGVSKERIIMLASSALVLTALTVTGVFVRSNRQNEEESNILDFSVIESGMSGDEENILIDENDGALFAEIGMDDLDYDPSFQEANSANVENEDTTHEDEKETEEKTGGQSMRGNSSKVNKEDNEEGMFDESEETMTETSESPETSETAEASGVSESSGIMEDREAIATTVQPVLDFNEEDGLAWPIVGNILINYSMDKTIYFPTLEQYKYHPAIVISATEGETITAAADARVISVDYDPQLGNTVVMDLGNQYELTYGQLDNITVSEGSYVAAGDIIGNVAHPTKYYSTEGANVYFKLTKDGQPVNPLSKLE